VAVCGLAGVLALDLLAHPDPDRSRTAPLAIAFWSAAVLGSGFGSVVVPVVVCAAAAGLVNLAAARPTALTPGRVAAGIALVSTVVLLARWDVHGAAMSAGLVIGGARLLAFPALGPVDRPAGRG
jgi:hypothetical protein